MTLFENRFDAGYRMAERIAAKNISLTDPIVLGIPRGGVPIGRCIADKFDIPLDIVLLRKLPIPSDPEMGFGAVTIDKTPIFNDRVLKRLNLPQDYITDIIDEVHQEVLRRNQIYRSGKPFPDLSGRSVIIADDGLATGFSMIAAISFVRSKQAKEIIVAAPVAHADAASIVDEHADKLFVDHVSDAFYFAVASFYESFPDMSDEDVTAILKQDTRTAINSG